MAQVEFVGFVKEVDNAGKRMKVTENHRKKGEDGNYYTSSRTFRSVKPGYESNLDFNNFSEGNMVVVTGREITEEWEYEGKKYRDLVVYADKVETKDRNTSDQKPPTPIRVQRTTDIALDLDSPF